jgi:hypothetical protein
VTSLSAPAVADGVVYVARTPSEPGGQQAVLAAYRSDCAMAQGASCSPLWLGAFGTELDARYADDAAPLVTRDSVLVIASGMPEPYDDLVAFPRNCPFGHTCQPQWIAHLADHVGRPTELASDGDTVYVAAGSNLEAFSVECGAAGGTCAPEWIDALPAPSSSPPAVSGGVVYVGAGNTVFAFPAACPQASCGELWSAGIGGLATAVAVASRPGAEDVVVVGKADGGVVALPVACATNGHGGCSPLWVAHTGGSPRPMTADGLVFVTAADGVFAFDPSCATGGGLCGPAWFVRMRDAGLAATSDAVYVGPAGGRLEGFTVPADSTPR